MCIKMHTYLLTVEGRIEIGTQKEHLKKNPKNCRN